MEIPTAVKVLSALAHESRLAVFRLLVRCGPRGMAAGEIAKQLGMPRPTLSFHLKELSAAGLLQDRRAGRSVIYSLDFAAIRSLLDYLVEDCCQGNVELCGRPVRAASDACLPDPAAPSRGDG